MTEQKPAVRKERDSMGEFDVPEDAYYGASTMRAVLNFPISDLRFPRTFIRALGLIKKFAAQVNRDLHLLDDERANAIIKAADEVAGGAFDEWFVLDIFQTGSGTSTNMNANEIIANRANEFLGSDKGTKTPVHPNDHVNLGQSSNDVIPTAIHVAAGIIIHEELLPALAALEGSLMRQRDAFWGIIKTGRTHLQDATPIRLGQEFAGYAGQIERAKHRAAQALDELAELALGGTAVGTGVSTHPEFAARVIDLLQQTLSISFHETTSHFSAQSTLDNVVSAHGQLRSIAVSLYSIANNIRLLSCGPRAGIGELALPAVQPGSSIMPGKVNPVIAESVTMVAAQVMGNDGIIGFAGAAGSYFELNVMMPVAAYALLQSAHILASSAENFAKACVDGIAATDRGPALVEQGLMLCTALAPKIGYDQAAAIAKAAFAHGTTVREEAKSMTSLTDEELAELLDPEAMTEPGRQPISAGG